MAPVNNELCAIEVSGRSISFALFPVARADLITSGEINFLACVSFFPQSLVSRFKSPERNSILNLDGKIFLSFFMLGKFRMKNYFFVPSRESNPKHSPKILNEGFS